MDRLLIILALLGCQMLLMGCSISDAPPPLTAEEHETSVDDETLDSNDVSPCEITMEMVGQTVSVFGRVALVARDNPDGIFAELETEGCKVGVFAPTEIWNQWDSEQQSMMREDARILVHGRLVSFDGELIVDVRKPPQSYANTSDAPKATDAPVEDLSPESGLDLPPAPAEAQLDVPIIYSGYDGVPGLCYLGAAAMLVKYDHPEAEFADVIALSGIGSSALHLDYPEMSMLSSRLADQSIVYMANNMHASYVLGYKNGGTGSDPNYPVHLPFEDYAAHLVHFDGSEDALDFLRRAVGSGHPVMVHLNLYYVYDDFSEVSDYWKEQVGKDAASHYMVVTGYQDNMLILNDPTDPTEAAASLTTSTDSFVQAWGETLDFPNAPPLGPYWMLFFSEPGIIPKSTAVIDLNLENARNTPSEIRSFAARADDSEFTLFLLLELANARLKFADYLEQNGWQDAAADYRSSGNLLIEMLTKRQADPAVLNEVATLEEAALASLAEGGK